MSSRRVCASQLTLVMNAPSVPIAPSLDYQVPAALLLWLGAATTFFHLYSDWPWTSALYYAIDTGLSIGFGALQPKVHGLGAANIQPLRQLIFSPLDSS